MVTVSPTKAQSVSGALILNRSHPFSDSVPLMFPVISMSESATICKVKKTCNYVNSIFQYYLLY